MATLVKHAGSSQYLLGGHVVYSNQWKQNEINVSKELIASYGAVSEEVARSMAEGAKANAGADIALAVTRCYREVCSQTSGHSIYFVL